MIRGTTAHGPWCQCPYHRPATAEPRRGLEGTNVVVWDAQHTEHLARRAAEIGDAEVEALCDAVHAGLAEDEELIDLIEVDPDYYEWMIRGYHLGWQTRPQEPQ